MAKLKKLFNIYNSAYCEKSHSSSGVELNSYYPAHHAKTNAYSHPNQLLCFTKENLDARNHIAKTSRAASP
jgi:hypothetical protein